MTKNKFNRNPKYSGTKTSFIFEDNLDMIWKAIHYTVDKYKIFPSQRKELLEELFSESFMSFQLAESSWDSEKDSSWNSWLFLKVYYGSSNYITRVFFKHADLDSVDIDNLNDDNSLINGEFLPYYNDVITVEKQEEIKKLFNFAFIKWSFEKVNFFFFISMFSTDNDFEEELLFILDKYKEDIIALGYDLPEKRELFEDNYSLFLDYHIFLDNYYLDKKDLKNRLANNVRNNIRYIIKVKN